MILAAAIKFNINNKEVVLCGARHGDVYKQMENLGFIPKHNYDEYEEIEGFIDHNNNFLTRPEAYEHAKMCGQIAAKIMYEREEQSRYNLISEDLW